MTPTLSEIENELGRVMSTEKARVWRLSVEADLNELRVENKHLEGMLNYYNQCGDVTRDLEAV